MSLLVTKVRVHYECTLRLTETEMRALDALVGYGTEKFISAFYQKMGRCYLGPHVKGLTDLFEKVKDVGRPQLSQIDKAREVLKKGRW